MNKTIGTTLSIFLILALIFAISQKDGDLADAGLEKKEAAFVLLPEKMKMKKGIQKNSKPEEKNYELRFANLVKEDFRSPIKEWDIDENGNVVSKATVFY